MGFAAADLLMFLAILVVRVAREAKDEKMTEIPLSMHRCEPAARDP